MAISIAEGKLNPCTMKAFPSSDTSYTTTFNNDKLLRDEMKTTASQESCFTVVSSHKSIGKRITGKFPTMYSNHEGIQLYLGFGRNKLSQHSPVLLIQKKKNYSFFGILCRYYPNLQQ